MNPTKIGSYDVIKIFSILDRHVEAKEIESRIDALVLGKPDQIGICSMGSEGDRLIIQYCDHEWRPITENYAENIADAIKDIERYYSVVEKESDAGSDRGAGSAH